MTIRTNTRDGSEIDLEGSAYVVTVGTETIELKTSATRFWSTPNRYDVTGVRVDEAAGTITVMFARDLSPPRVREATFDLETGVRISQTSDLSARQVLFLEMSGVYGATAGLESNGDLNGDGVVSVPPTVDVTGTVATNGLTTDTTALFTLEGGGFGIASEGDADARKIFGQRGDYVLPRDYEAVAVRPGDGGFYLLMSKIERDKSVTFQEQFIVDNGVSLGAAGAPITLTGRALIDAENAYNLDFNNDGTIGDADLVVARLDSAVNDPAGLGANGSLTDDPEGGIGIYRTQAGRFVIAEEAQQVGQVAGTTGPDPVGPSIFLKTASGADWTAPSGSVIFAVREVGTSGTYQIITRDGNLGASSTSYRVFDVSSTGVVGASVTVDYPQLIQLERTFRQDFDGNDVIGDVAGQRADASVRIGNGERALYLSDGDALFISADLDRQGEPIWNDPTDTNLLLRTVNGITSEDGKVWSPALSASGAEAIAVRETASNYIVLSRVPSIVNPESWEDYTYIEQSFSKTGIEVRGRFIVDITAQREALYFEDFNGDGIIDLTTVSFTNTAQFVTPPNGVRLDGHRLILTAEQARAMSNSESTAAGVLAVEGIGVLGLNTPEAAAIFRDGAFEIDRKFLLETPENLATGSDLLSLTVTGSGSIVEFRFTVPNHALDDTATVKVNGLPQGVTASLLSEAGDLREGMPLTGGTYILRIDTTLAESRYFSFTLEQELPYGWERAAIARDNLLQITDTTLSADLDLRQVDPDHVVLRFGTSEGTSLEVPAGQTLTIHAEHAAALTLTGDGTVVLLGDLRGHDFSGITAATVDFSQANVLTDPEGSGELNFPTDASLWPPIDTEGVLWVLRGGQADLVTRTEGLQILGRKDVKPVGNIRIVDDVDGLDLSQIDVAYIDMSGATGTPDKLPQISTDRFLLLRADQADGLSESLDGARLHLTSASLGYLAQNPVDFSELDLGGGMFTAIVTADLELDPNVDLGALQLTVLGAGTTLTLTGAQAEGRIINDSVSIWTRDTNRDILQTGVAGDVVITDPAATINLSNLGRITGVGADGQPDGTTPQNEALFVTLSVSQTTDFTGNSSFGVAPTAAVRGDASQSPPGLRIDAYDVGAYATLTLTAAQASFREASGTGTVEIVDLDAQTDLWGFQRGSSPTVNVSVGKVSDLRSNASLNDAIDAYDLGGCDTSMLEIQATGRIISGNADTALDVYGLTSATDLSGVSSALDVTVFLSGAEVDIRGNDTLATVDRFNIGEGGILDADTARLGEIVTFVEGTANLYVAEDEVLTKSFTFTNSQATLHLANGVDISDATLAGVDTFALANGASVTMSIQQHNDVTSITAAGIETITFSDAGETTGFAAVETYVLASTSGNDFRLGASDQNVTGGSQDDLVRTGTFTSFEGVVFALGGGSNTMVVETTGSDLSGINGGHALTADIVTIDGLANVAMTGAQHNAITTLNAEGVNTFTFTDAVTATGFANVETYVLADGTNSFTLGASGQNVTATGGEVTLNTGDLNAYSGTITGAVLKLIVPEDAEYVNLTGLSTASIRNISEIEVAGNAQVHLTAAGADGLSVTGDGDVIVEGITPNTDLSGLTVTGEVRVKTTGHVDARGEGDFSTVDIFEMQGGSLQVNAAQLGTKVMFDGGNATVIVDEDFEAADYTFAQNSTLVLEEGADISGLNGGGATTAQILRVEGAVKMTALQHLAATVQPDPETDTQITFVGRVFTSTDDGDQALAGAAGIDTYVLGGNTDERNLFDIGGNGQSVIGGAANDSVWIGNFDAGAIELGVGANVLGVQRSNSIVSAGENIADADNGGSFEIFVWHGSGAVTLTRTQHEAATDITNDITRFGIFHFGPDNSNEIKVAIDGDGVINAKANVTGYQLSDAGNTIILSVATTGVDVTTGTGSHVVQIDGLSLTGTINGASADDLTLDVAGQTNLTGANLIGITAITLAENATLTLTAAQANGLTVTGSGSVIVEGFVANTDLAAFDKDLTIHATVTTQRENLRETASVADLASLEMVPGQNPVATDVLLTGAQASGLTIKGPQNYAIWLKDIPSNADLSGVENTIFVRVLLSENADVSDAVDVSPVREYFLFGQTLTIDAAQLYQFGQQPTVYAGGEGFHFNYMDWNTEATGSKVIVSGVKGLTDLSSFISTSYGTPELVARINADDTVDLTGNGTPARVTAYEVETNATLTLNAADASGRDGSGAGAITIAALNGSGADISGITPGGGVTLALGSAGATLASTFAFADVSYNISADGKQTLDITAAGSLPDGTEFVVGESVTLRLSAEQADELSVTGAGTVIVEGVNASTDLDSIDVERLEVHLDYSTGTVDLRGNETLGSVDRYQLSGQGGFSFVLTGDQATGVEIESLATSLAHVPVIIGVPSDADFSKISSQSPGRSVFYAMLDEDVELADTVDLGDIAALFLGGRELSIDAASLKSGLVRFRLGDYEPIWFDGFKPSPDAESTGSVVIRGVQDDTHLWDFNNFAYGRPPVTARIDEGPVDLRGNETTVELVTTYEVQAGATLTLTESQVTNAALQGLSPAFFNTMVSVTGDGALVVDGLASNTDLSQVAQSLTLDVLVTDSVDVTANATLGNVDAFIVSEGATLTLTAAQADGLSVTGAGNVIITALDGSDADISGIVVDGTVSLDAGNPNPELGVEFTFGARSYEVIGAGTLDITAVADVSAVTGFGVAAESVLLATAAQIEALSGPGAISGTGGVVVTGVNASTDIDAGVFGTGLSSVTAVLEGQADLGALSWANEIVLGGNALTVPLADLSAALSDQVFSGPGRLVVSGVEDDGEIDLNGLPEGVNVVLSGLASGHSVTILNRPEGVSVTVDGLAGSLVWSGQDEQLTLFETISDAVNAQKSDAAIMIGAGTFTETVDVRGTSDLVFLGAQAGISAGVGGLRDITSTESETILDGRFDFGGGSPTVDGIMIDGMRLQGEAFSAIRVDGDFVLRNTIVDHNKGSWGLSFPSFGTPTIELSNNTIVGARGIEQGFGGIQSTLIQGNVFDTTNGAVLISNSASPGIATITGNQFTGPGVSILQDGMTVTDNTFEPGGTYGIRIFETEDGTYTGNTFIGEGVGILLESGANPDSDMRKNTVEGNILTNNAILNQQSAPVFFGVNTIDGDDVVLIAGGNGDDRLEGTASNEFFFGGAGVDTFVFSNQSIGTNTITDFGGAGVVGGDLIDVSGLGVVSLTGLSIQTQGGDTVITAADSQFEGSITLSGVTSQLIEDDFVFFSEA